MTIGPIIFCTIVSNFIAGMDDSEESSAGRAKSSDLFEIVTTVALAMGLFAHNSDETG